MKFSLGIAIGVLTLIITTSAFAATPERIRGKVVDLRDGTLIVKTSAGSTEKIVLMKDTAYAIASPATRADVAAGRYIGTATKTIDGKLVALEVTIFAPSMTGAGEGHYPWDNIPDTTVVTYKGGAQTVLLPPTAPINNVAPATSASIAKGAQVFVVAEPGAGGLRAVYLVIATGTARLAM